MLKFVTICKFLSIKFQIWTKFIQNLAKLSHNQTRILTINLRKI